jgi:4-carboxymuconolactone decarboxylase
MESAGGAPASLRVCAIIRSGTLQKLSIIRFYPAAQRFHMANLRDPRGANLKAEDQKSGARELRYSILPDRMPPIPFEKMSAAQQEVATEIAAGPRGKVEGPYWPIIRSPGLTRHIQKVGAYFRYECPLERRINEMAALMAARAWSQQFVWDVHILQALDAGLPPAVAQALAEGRRPDDMAPPEAALHDFVAELLATKGVSDATYAKAVKEFTEEGVIDILGIVGYYSTLGMIMNVGRTTLLADRKLPMDPLPLQLRSLEADPLRSTTR